MKRGVFLTALLVLGLLSSGLVSAQTICSASDQIILRLSSETNAHGEVFDGSGSYSYEICYDDLFGSAYAGGNSQTCDGSNVVLRLSDLTNAHGESPTLNTTGYSDVCFGDLSCVARSTTCNIGETEVLRLDASTNAHLETVDGLGGYGTRICCVAGGGPISGAFNSVEWQDLAGNTIGDPTEIRSYLGSTVELIADTSFPEGTTINFDIEEDDGVAGTDGDVAIGLSGDVNASGTAVVEWTITQNDIDKADSFLEYSDGVAEFLFTANELSGGDSLQSLILEVEDNVDPNDNKPTAVIAGELVHKGIYFIDVPIEFNHTSFDLEGPLSSVEWSVIQSDGLKDSDFTSSDESFSQTFTTSGQRIITLRVTDSIGQAHEAQIGILLMENTNGGEILSFVNVPNHKVVVPISDRDSDGDLDNVVDYFADDSYVVAITGLASCPGTLPLVNCAEGNCPAATENSPAGCSGTVPLIIPGPRPFTGLFFNYTTDYGFNFGSDANYSGSVPYPSSSSAFNDKSLRLELERGASGNQENHTRFFTLGQCIADGTKFLSLDGNGKVIEELSTLTDTGACAGADGLYNTGDECCPTGFMCDGTSGTEVCVASSDPIGECSDYTDETICEDDDFNAAELDPLWDLNDCGEFVNGRIVKCSCGWDPNEGSSGECGFVVEKNSPSDPLGVDACECTQHSTTSECVNGRLTISANVFESGMCFPGECVPLDPQSIPCGRLNIELPFFGYSQFLISVIAVFFIYLVVFIRKNK